MPRDKSRSHEKIIIAAKEEFREYGFEKASMRRIGKRCDLTAAALYRHFDSKEAMYDALVGPAAEDLKEWVEKNIFGQEEEMRRIFAEQGQAECDLLWNKIIIEMMETFIYPRIDEFSMLLGKSSGSKYETLADELIREHQLRIRNHINMVRSHGFKVEDIPDDELFILLSAYIKTLLDPIAKGYPLEQALRFYETVDCVFSPGWRALLGTEQQQ